ncbi:hypothetical protein [Pseudomonas vancouverensis]|uniref:hypothetical protein n=1 Tax=Pseudomonas vancouverensis TaxID=95300 RepID=UPI0018D314BF|nr:hypothetical protein [Pseudomonas vancouverensis]
MDEYSKLKMALGISTRSLVHRWDKAGAPGQIPGYATHVEATSRAAKYMSGGGYIGIGIGGVSSLLAIQEVCVGDSGTACEKIKFTEGGKFALSTLGGYAGGELAYLASGPICLFLGFTTGIGGVVCIAGVVGTGALGGSVAGGVAGEFLGEKLYEIRLQ